MPKSTEYEVVYQNKPYELELTATSHDAIALKELHPFTHCIRLNCQSGQAYVSSVHFQVAAAPPPPVAPTEHKEKEPEPIVSQPAEVVNADWDDNVDDEALDFFSD